jgi:general secretion pathway protein L
MLVGSICWVERTFESMAEGAVIRSNDLPGLTARWRGFVSWWLAEFRAAVPSDWQSRINGEAAPVLLIRRDRDFVICEITSARLSAERRFPPGLFGAAALSAWLSECGLARDQVIAGLAIDRALFFLREVAIPKAALAALPKILEQEIVRRTPFQPSEIWHAATVADAAAVGLAPGIMAMSHWIIRKDRAEAALADVGLNPDDVDFLAASDGGGAPLIPFRAIEQKDPLWAWRAVKLLAAAAVGAVLLGLLAFEWCQSSAANKLEASLEQAAQGGTVTAGANQASRLFSRKADAGVLEVWEELSRILPDHTFLTEARIVDGKVTISGFSADAAGLVRSIDQSTLFTGATLVAAITPDANERKDRFSLSFRVRGSRTPGPSARAPARESSIDRGRGSL